MHIRPVPHPCMKHMDWGELDWVVSCESSKPRDQQVSDERVDSRLKRLEGEGEEELSLPLSSSSSFPFLRSISELYHVLYCFGSLDKDTAGFERTGRWTSAAFDGDGKAVRSAG